MLNSEIVMGVSLMLLFIIGRIELGFSTILMAHITFNIPYVHPERYAQIKADEQKRL